MEAKEDIKTILVLIERFLPNFTATWDDLSKLNQSFVINFYSNYINELANNCQLILGCNFENVFDSCPQGIDKEIYLLLFTRYILNKIGVPYFTICDLYRPSNRTRTTMKICLNFLFYIIDTMPTSQDIVKTFNEEVENVRSLNERILKKRTDVGDATYRIGLLKEKLEELNNKYEIEKKIQSSPLDSQCQLEKEIEQFEEEMKALSNNINSKQHDLNILNEEIKVLSDEVVSDDYESYNNILEQVGDKLKNTDCLMTKKQKILEENQKELDYINDLCLDVQKIDMSALDHVKEIDHLKQKISDIESLASDITEIQKNYKVKSQKITDDDREFQDGIRQIEQKLSEKNEQITAYKQKLSAEIITLKKLVSQHKELKEKLHISKEECTKQQAEQDNLEKECKQSYQRLLNCLSLVTTEFNDLLSDRLKQ